MVEIWAEIDPQRSGLKTAQLPITRVAPERIERREPLVPTFFSAANIFYFCALFYRLHDTDTTEWAHMPQQKVG